VKYSLEILKPLVESSTTVAEVGRKLNLSPRGGNMTYLRQRIDYFGIDTSHFVKSSWSKDPKRRFEVHRRKPEEILVKQSPNKFRENSNRLTRALLEIGRPYICEACNNTGIWNNKPITLHVDHINGDSSDNTSENLRFLCPNCHSQTPTHCRPKNSSGKIYPHQIGHMIASRWQTVSLPQSETDLCSCGLMKKVASKHCRSCAAKNRKPTPRSTKIAWPDHNTLQKMVDDSSYLAVGRDLGVSDNAVRKRLKNHCNDHNSNDVE
jgi:hypothetical protein